MKQKQFQFITFAHFGDFIVRDHRVHDVRIMPGVTFLDLMIRLLKQKGFVIDRFVLSKVLFKQAIAVTEKRDKKVSIDVVWQNQCWELTAKSCSVTVQNGETQEPDHWDVHLTCQLVEDKAHTEAIPLSISIAQIKQQAASIIDMDQAYQFARSVEIQLTPNYALPVLLAALANGDISADEAEQLMDRE